MKMKKSFDLFLAAAYGVLVILELLLFGGCYFMAQAGKLSLGGALGTALAGSLVLAAVLLWVMCVHWHSKTRSTQTALGSAWRQIQEVQSQKRQEQLNALQSQINPHFLYNTLDTIRGLALEHGVYDVADIVATLSSMFKYSMDYANCMVAVSDELEHLNSYLKIQSLRFPNKFTYEKQIDCDYNILRQVQMPKLMLQPIVENAFSHGLKKVTSGGKIELQLTASNFDFQICIRDNGVGMDDTQVLELNRRFLTAETSGLGGSGIALYNINSRIKLYCGEKYGLHIASTPGYGTEVTLSLPLTTAEGLLR